MDKKQQAVREMEQKHADEKSSLKQLSQEATAVWEEVGGALSLQSQIQHQVQQLLDLIQEGQKLLHPSQELLGYVVVDNYYEERVLSMGYLDVRAVSS